MTTQHHGTADRYGGVGIVQRRSKTSRDTRFARRLVSVGLGAVIAATTAVPAASAATANGMSTVRAGALDRDSAVRAVTAVAAAVDGRLSTRSSQCGTGIGPTKYSTTEMIKGKWVVVNCGPATATLHYQGKTYTFKHGTCFLYLGFKLNLGSSLLIPPAKGDGGYSNMAIILAAHQNATIGATTGSVTIGGVAKFSSIASRGTFSSITNGLKFSGSWNCGGPIRKS
ncbi:MAG TPA: hypothetical protein VIJ86_09765 [Acidimicrobiales bacterium]